MSTEVEARRQRRRVVTRESAWMRAERGRELKKHQERLRNMKACVDSSPAVVGNALQLQHQRRSQATTLDKDKLRTIEKQNYRLLMRLRYIHKNYSLYMPKKQVYLLRGEACRLNKPLKKPTKSQEMVECSQDTSRSHNTHCKDNPDEMVHRVAALNLLGDSSYSMQKD